jgi:hypothetical protein
MTFLEELIFKRASQGITVKLQMGRPVAIAIKKPSHEDQESHTRQIWIIFTFGREKLDIKHYSIHYSVYFKGRSLCSLKTYIFSSSYLKLI